MEAALEHHQAGYSLKRSRRLIECGGKSKDSALSEVQLSSLSALLIVACQRDHPQIHRDRNRSVNN